MEFVQRYLRGHVVRTVIQVLPIARVFQLLLAKRTAKPANPKSQESAIGFSEHKSEGDMDQQVREFFLQYQEANF